ncbi:MAG TPA: NmrA family NAD(P)-binding protein [Aromatoleum sp.]|uniref:NmrA family NAD(P)-binding protein n=1 Tax=Aromatoleum sp. TaxID=2307007 RepID=UPI002B49AA26|nr:NmrA family NAD(P)-binding protein [Aromatoleum sp.]HJV27693.1 NmrA family NAD(P)-binding protein [Aromatoleum sp.]
MSRKTITVFAATGSAGSACVEELLRQDVFNVQVLARAGGLQEKSSSGLLNSDNTKQQRWNDWQRRGVVVKQADVTDHASLIPALEGTDYLVSCVPLFATESQYPLIWAAKEAGVERFVPSEFGFIYDWEQFWPTDNAHKTAARQKAFIRRVIELAGLDFTIIPAGLWIEYFMAEPVAVMGDGNTKISWSTAQDVGRIIPHVLAHPASRNAVCPVAATAYLTWNELLDARERILGRKVERVYMSHADWRKVYAKTPDGPMKAIMGIGVAATECPEGMPLWAHWNALHLPHFKGTPLEQLFPDYIEPRVRELTAALV